MAFDNSNSRANKTGQAQAGESRIAFTRAGFPSSHQETNFALVEPLSERELEVLRLIEEGISNKAIADRLYLSLATIKTHINHLYAKLGVENRVQALARARTLKLL